MDNFPEKQEGIKKPSQNRPPNYIFTEIDSPPPYHLRRTLDEFKEMSCPWSQSQENQSSPNISYHFYLGLRFSVVVFLGGVVLGAGIFVSKVSSKSACPFAEAAQVTRADYEKLRKDMSRTDIEATLGPGVETRQAQNKTHLVWENCDGSNLEVILENGVLAVKNQSNLK
ncbi:hypothetical protein N836_13710 [Leptolyngbya sp. Heron Island J]|uniref:hypothetical protein n=1 Tax=Leptolyngbya sp. Heron Island J TaxID=1385935 RepID=UPI0003B96CF9|nr:hypothetical protein [Leptolyngbya sp. Heron Island J]ESA35116.1 hypothetical protein N836_13710 [Leptolyngbya sp. Heron Island J]